VNEETEFEGEALAKGKEQTPNRSEEEKVSGSKEDEVLKECKQWYHQYNVKPGESFGSMPKSLHDKWSSNDCDTYALTGKLDGDSTKNDGADPKQMLVNRCLKITQKNNLDVNSKGGLSVLSKEDKKEYSRLHCTARIAESLIDGQPKVDCTNRMESSSQLPWVAVAVSATSRGIKFKNVQELALFSILLPSLVQTVECGFNYRVVLAFDYGDAFFDSEEGTSKVKEWFEENVRKKLAEKGVTGELLFAPVQNDVKKPGPAFEAMTKKAYEAGSDYIYRVNDDTQFIDPFASVMVGALQEMGEPFGVVGPRCHGQSTRILTHDFTHRTHMEIFNGYYYPPQLSDWWMDDWISRVYGKSRTRMAMSAKVFHHTGKHGSRYSVDQSHKRFLEGLVKEGHDRIADYMESKKILGPQQIKKYRKDRTDAKNFLTV